MRNRLIVITGPTGSGKSELAMQLAYRYGCDIISADSRQIYRDLPITTAAPTEADRLAVRHHFVGTLPIDAYYSAAQFESDVMTLLPRLFEQSPVQIMCGGSMLYVDAVVRGIDPLPTISAAIRAECAAMLAEQGLDAVVDRLRLLDPQYAATADLRNPVRAVHALEICLEARVPYSSLRTSTVKTRPFDIEQWYIDMPRDQLMNRINDRVIKMVELGMLDEVRRLLPYRRLNAMNTVGVKEMLRVIDGEWSLDTAVARLQKNTRVYAKKQLTWLKTRPDIHPYPDDAHFPASPSM